MDKADIETDLVALKLLQGVCKLGYSPPEVLKLLQGICKLGYSLSEVLNKLRRKEAPKHFNSSYKIYIFKKIVTTLAAQKRKKGRGPSAIFSLNRAYKDLSYNKKFKNLVEKKEKKKFTSEKFIRHLEYIWKVIPVADKVINILKKIPVEGLPTLLPQYNQIRMAEKIRFELEDKQENRRKTHSHY